MLCFVDEFAGKFCRAKGALFSKFLWSQLADSVYVPCKFSKISCVVTEILTVQTGDKLRCTKFGC